MTGVQTCALPISGLHSVTQNTWASLHHHHYGHYLCALQHVCWKHSPSLTYPTNTHLHTNATLKPPNLAPIHIFELVWHPHRIEPNKPVIRVPVQMEVATSTHPTPLDWAIVKLVPPLHPAAPVRCHCGQLVPISGNQVSHSFPLHHTFRPFISLSL